MIHPTVHLNGTSKDTLIEQWCTASSALLDAERAIQQCAPNARDYYPQGAEAFVAALDEYRKHAAALFAARQYLETLIEHCDA